MKSTNSTPTQSNLFALVDWFQFKLKNVSVSEICKFLKLPSDVWVISKGKLAGYQQFIAYAEFCNIRIYMNNFSLLDYDSDFDDFEIDEPKENEYSQIMVQFSGRGCRYFEDVVLKNNSLTWSLFFENLFDTFEKVDVRRIDLNLNDVNENPYFTPTSILNLCEKNRFKYGRSTSYASVGTYRLGQTTYLGSPKTSDRLIIIYDKQSERLAKGQLFEASQFPSWVRLEIRFIRKIAQEMTKKIAKEKIDIIDIIKGYLKQQLHFYSDITQEKEMRFWERYLGASKPFKIVIKHENTTLEEKANWLDFGGGLSVTRVLEFLTNYGLAPKNVGSVYENAEKKKIPKSLAISVIDYLDKVKRLDLIPEVLKMIDKK